MPGSSTSRIDEVVVVDADLLQRGVAVARDVDRIGVLAQALGEHGGGDGLVFDDQYSHRRYQRRQCQALRDLLLDLGDVAGRLLRIVAAGAECIAPLPLRQARSAARTSSVRLPV